MSAERVVVVVVALLAASRQYTSTLCTKFCLFSRCTEESTLTDIQELELENLIYQYVPYVRVNTESTAKCDIPEFRINLIIFTPKQAQVWMYFTCDIN